MKFKTFLCSSILVLFLSTPAFAGPGDYSLRFKGGPAFGLQDWGNQVRFGAEFDYDLGYSMGVGLLGLFGVSDDFRFTLMPTFRYDIVYIGPSSIYGTFGLGYGLYKGDNALDMRFGAGITLPLGDRFEVNSDFNIFMAPAGTPGTPVTAEWLIAFGFRFH